jgi:hypothetical protein
MEEYIREHFQYDPLSGSISRDDRKNSNGSYDKDGYLILKVKRKQIKAHRLAWFLYYGSFPEDEIDHINRVRFDNRIENLRVVNRSGNIANTYRKKNRDSGYVGIHVDKKTKGLIAKYCVKHNGKTYRFRKLNDAVLFRTNKGLEV